MQLFEAGGYQNLSTQLNQFDNCIANEYDAIIIAAISADGVGAAGQKGGRRGHPGHRLRQRHQRAGDLRPRHCQLHRSRTSWPANYVLEDTPIQPTTVIGFFPGPQGANFSDDAVKGFKEAMKGRLSRSRSHRRGEPASTSSSISSQNALQAYPEINYIVAIDPGAQGAVTVLRNSRKLGKIKVASINIIPPVYHEHRRGRDGGVGRRLHRHPGQVRGRHGGPPSGEAGSAGPRPPGLRPAFSPRKT